MILQVRLRNTGKGLGFRVVRLRNTGDSLLSAGGRGRPKLSPISTPSALPGPHMGSCQNYGPFLGTLNIRCRIILRTQKGTIILTTTHITYTFKDFCKEVIVGSTKEGLIGSR